jgi:drug/metabolite transporter (DMT)-like permease
MDLLLRVLSGAGSLVSFVCFVVVVVKMFQNNQVGLGVASIIGLPCVIGYFIALFAGWKNRTAWKLEKVMPIFTLAFGITLVASCLWFVNTWNQGMEERQQPNSEFESDLEVPQISAPQQ